MEINDELKIETYKRLGEIGVLGLKTGFLLNGGAAIAILTFVGNIVQTDKNLAGELASSKENFVDGIRVRRCSGCSYLYYAIAIIS